MAHKLTENVLHRKVIAKSNVKSADSLFHESTMNVLCCQLSVIGSIKWMLKLLIMEFTLGTKKENQLEEIVGQMIRLTFLYSVLG